LIMSKRTEYGLRAAIQLARLWPNGYIQTKDMAEEEKLPSKFLESILLALRRGGYLESKVGSGGGYRLSHPPGEICIGDLIRRLEGKQEVKRTELPLESTPGKIAIQLIKEKMSRSTDDVLDQLTLEELLDQITRLAGGNSMYFI
jgi:Rrf2 family protein